MSATVNKPSAAVIPRQQTIDMNKAIVVRSADGTEIRRMITKMKLCTSDGTLVKIMDGKKGYSFNDRDTGEKVTIPDRGPTLIPSATAYMTLASKCGVSIEHPDTVIVGGTEQPNGYCSPEGTYYFRSRAGGFTANGQPFITDRTVDFNVHRYNIQDLLAKAKKDKFAKYFKVIPFKGKDKDGVMKGAPGDSWAGYQIDESIVLWVDCSCADFVDWLSEMNNRIKNAVRVAQTFADRNAIAAHPSLPVRKKFETAEAIVDCIAWVAKQGNNTFKLLEKDSTAVTIDVSAESIVADDEEVRQTVAAEAAAAPVDATDTVPEPEEELPSKEPETSNKTNPNQVESFSPTQSSQLSAEEAEIRTNLVTAIRARKKKSPMAFATALKNLNIPADKWEEFSTDSLTELNESLRKS